MNFSVPTAGLNYNLVRPIGTIRNISDDPKPSIKMNSEFQERMRRIFNHGVDDDDNDDDEGEADMKDKSSNKGNGRTSISTATKCCDENNTNIYYHLLITSSSFFAFLKFALFVENGVFIT